MCQHGDGAGLERSGEPGDRLEFELAQSGDGRLLALGLRRPTVPPEAPDQPEATSGAERQS
jgi:hypothetical protein